jgi:hypothetical protein
MSQNIKDTQYMIIIWQQMSKVGDLRLLTVSLYEKIMSEAFHRARKWLKSKTICLRRYSTYVTITLLLGLVKIKVSELDIQYINQRSHGN